jgi:hypothetical protein
MGCWPDCGGSAAPLAPSVTFARKTKPLPPSAHPFTTETTVATAATPFLPAVVRYLTRSRA